MRARLLYCRLVQRDSIGLVFEVFIRTRSIDYRYSLSYTEHISYLGLLLFLGRLSNGWRKYGVLLDSALSGK